VKFNHYSQTEHIHLHLITLADPRRRYLRISLGFIHQLILNVN